MPLRSHPLESSFSRLEKFRLYETATFYYLVGFDNQETLFRLLKINRLIQRPKSLAEIVREDDLVYTAADIAEILKMIDEGNKTSGGLVKICSAYGIVGFVRFLDCFYLTLITQRKEVGCIAGSFVYSIKATEMFPVRPRDEPETNAFRSLWKKLNKKLSQSSVEIAENRYMGLFQFIDMTKDFFFSYTYDLTRSLQYNYMHAAANKSINRQNPASAQEQIATAPQDIFQWNHYQIHELQEILGPVGSSHWILPLIHGSYQQKRFSLFGKCLDVIMIARRSRHYAGTRYLKRGINVHGKAANDCEVEQVTQHDDSYRSHYCSYLQMRASIPTYWYQETSVTMPKPPILVNRVDPDYRATEEHVADLFRRYSSPIIALDLVKQHEKRPRESLVGGMFRQAIEVVNESLPVEHKVRYIALDYSRITSIAKGKSKGSKGVGPGAVVGHEWKNLVENTLTADSPVGGDPAVPGTAAHAAAITRDSPVMFAGGSFSAKSGGPDPIGGAGASGLGSPAGIADEGAVVGSAAQPQAPRWHGTDVRIDVLRELEDVATMTLAETAFFCNTGDYLDRVRILPTAKLAKVKEVGHLEQRGVLRTNCIDCLDRTNGAQFAVAMKFLSVSLQALGICGAGQGLEPTNQMLVSLMEMYGEMGDKIALQYGGSEAHRKVPGGQVASSAKQSELLTSIKRYYSNAFTDMVKQDAMNVFLGCFQPADNATPLWDLESDYSLHNQSLCPPPSLVNKVLFDKIYLDSHALSLPVVRQLIESSIKKALTDTHKERVALVPVDSKKRLKKILQSEDLVIRTEKIEDVVSYLRHLGIPEIDRERLLRGYFIRHATALQRELEEAANAAQHDGGETPPPGGAGTDQKGSAPQFPSRIHLKIAIRNIGRLEKRKFLRAVASKRVSNIATMWWKSALLDYEESLYGVSQEGQVIAAARFTPQPVQKPPSYFNRAYTPDQLSEFDVLLSLDFFSPIDVARDVADTGRFSPLPKDAPIRAKAPIADHGAVAAAAAAMARKFDREYLHGHHRSKDSFAAAHMYDEYPSGAVSSSTPGAGLHTTADSYVGPLPDGVLSAAHNDGTGSYPDATDAVTANAGFQITRYMRKLVGGFLRKEDASAAPTTAGKATHKAREGKREWNWFHHMINFHEHRVSRKTSALYTRYVTVSQNPLLLMEKIGNQRIAEEEYFLLLRDINIDVDNVSGMEHLSIEGYVSSEINQGVFQGMPQRESAVAAYAFLHTALVQVEPELEDPAAGLEGAARDPFAPAPTSGRGSTTRRRAQTTAPTAAGEGHGAGTQHHRAASDGTAAGHHVSDPRLLLRMALKKNPALDAHIERCLMHVDHVRGLDREFRRMIGDYIAQQATYAREMSYDHLSTRLSASTTEHSILEYAMQFDHRALAQDIENIDFLARCSPTYESFHELINLRQTLAPVQAEVRESKKQLLRERQLQREAEEAAARKAARERADSATESSVSEQLGLGGHIPGLAEDLHRDYSLDMYGRPFPYVDNIGLTGVQNPPGQPQLFYQMDSDLYVRSTNPFMQLNEVAVNSLSHALYAF